MRLKVIAIVERGNAQNERLHLSVLADANLVNYLILATKRINPNSISTVPKYTYWLPAGNVRPGDNVVIYTRAGVNNRNIRSDGGTDHFFFCGLPNTIWDNPTSCAVLVEINTWETST